jgi:tetratricopeptide (TPR) repeat protein
LLFDLRGRGRRRTIQIVYASLAVILASGLILFGVGSGLAGGLIDAINGNSGGGSSNSLLQKQADTLEKRVQRNPQDGATWAKLARTQFQLAAGTIDQTTGQYSKDGKKDLAAAGVSWDRYLALTPEKPDPAIAALMVQAYIQLGNAAKASDAQEIVTAVTPNRNNYLALAKLAYAAGQTRKGDLAAAKALAGTPKDLRTTVKQQLDQAKQQGSKAAGGAAGGTPTPPPSG